jgi:hypothetical protein
MARDRLAGTGNVIRFPIEERARPTLGLMRELAPDVRAVELTTEAFDLPLPPADLRHRVDGEAAEYIVNNIDARPSDARDATLRSMLDPLVAEAVRASRAWRRAATTAADARQRMAQARTEGGYWMAALETRLNEAEREAAGLLLEAHVRNEETEGVARAVRQARSGQAWAPFDIRSEAEALFFGDDRTSA